MTTVQSVNRALDLLEAVSRDGGGLVEISQRVDLPLTTTSRLLATLEARHAVTRNHAGAYELGGLLAQLIATQIPISMLESVARPHLEATARGTDEAVALSIPLEADSLTIVQVDAPKPVRAEDWTGARWPLTAGGSGWAMLATWPAARREALLTGPLQGTASGGATTETEIRGRIDDAAATGVSWTIDGYVEGLSSVAAAVVDRSGSAVASVQIYGPSYRFPAEQGRTPLEEAVGDLAETISRQLTSSTPADGSR